MCGGVYCYQRASIYRCTLRFCRSESLISLPKYLILEALQLGEEAFTSCREATGKGEKPNAESPIVDYPTGGGESSYDDQETITQPDIP